MAAKNKNTIKFGEEISEKLLEKIRQEAIEEYKKDMARTTVKKEYQCSHCKILPRTYGQKALDLQVDYREGLETKSQHMKMMEDWFM